MPFGTYHCLVLLVYVLLADAMYEIGDYLKLCGVEFYAWQNYVKVVNLHFTSDYT